VLINREISEVRGDLFRSHNPAAAESPSRWWS
jgi:hypothetical protein